MAMPPFLFSGALFAKAHRWAFVSCARIARQHLGDHRNAAHFVLAGGGVSGRGIPKGWLSATVLRPVQRPKDPEDRVDEHDGCAFKVSGGMFSSALRLDVQ